MLRSKPHLTARELLLMVDREMASRNLERARTHLAGCALCRSRMEEVERTLAETRHLCDGDTSGLIPPADASRERLRMRIVELSAQPRPPSLPPRLIDC